jgi:hypothetical protein
MLFAYGHKNHDASHLSALNTTCNSYGHFIKEIIADAGSVEGSADVKLTCSQMNFVMLPQPTDMQYLNYVERSVQTIDNKISPTLATAMAGCTLVTRHEEFCGHAPNIDELFRYRLGQFVTVTKPEDKRTKNDHAMRGSVCIALHSAGDQGVWVWYPGTRKALKRGHLYVRPVIYDGIQNQSLMIEDAGSSKGAMTYPHPSIVKFIERHVEMECAEADKMELSGTGDTPVSPKSTKADVLSDESLSVTLQPVLPMDMVLKDELVGDALIGMLLA